MNQTELINNHTELEKLVLQGKIIKAIEKLEIIIETDSYSYLKNRLFDIKNSYLNMLHYIFEDINDPEQEKIFNLIQIGLLELNDELKFLELRKVSSNYFFDRNRVEEVRNNSSSTLIGAIQKLYDKKLLIQEGFSVDNSKDLKEIEIELLNLNKDLFNYLFSKYKLENSEMNEILYALSSNHFPEYIKASIITAIGLSITFFFDLNKLQILINTSINSDIDEICKTRSLVSVIIVLQLFNDRMKLHHNVITQLQSIIENRDSRRLIVGITTLLIKARDTERISKKISEELIPGLMELQKKQLKGLKINNLENEKDFFDKNPDWQEKIKKSGLEKKLQEYSEMQLEGIDVFHSTFSNLKNFPFFNEVNNWFLPFFKSHQAISELFNNKDKTFADVAFFDSSQISNSDKYSFCFSILAAPKNNREMLLQNMNINDPNFDATKFDNTKENPLQRKLNIANQYVIDLYRFLKLSPHKQNFKDVFNIDFKIDESSLLIAFFDKDELLSLTDFCFNKNFFSVALELYDYIIKIQKDKTSSTIYQKKGFCLQMMNNRPEALNAYITADIIEPDKIWTLKRIAQIYKEINNHSKALAYYKRLLNLDENNLNIELNIAHCYFELKAYDKALNIYYKIDLMSEAQNISALKAIGWISFIQSKYENAEKYYLQIVGSDNSSADDWMNLGHIYLVQDKFKLALNCYQKTYEMKKGIDVFIKSFKDDEYILLQKGINVEYQNFLFDKLQST